MVSISQIVKKIVCSKPFLQDALSKGIINNAALAQQIIPEIEDELQKKVNFSSVNMAIRRLSESIKPIFPINAKFNSESSITIKSDLVQITTFLDNKIQKHIENLQKNVCMKEGDILTITQGIHEIMIITNKKYKTQLKKIENQLIKKQIEELASLTIKIPNNSFQNVGLYYLATKELAWENIPIIDIVSTLTEMTFIVKEKNVSKSFEVLNKLIKKNKD